MIATATHKGITIWHVGLNPDQVGRLSVEKVALLSGHDGGVCILFLTSIVIKLQLLRKNVGK